MSQLIECPECKKHLQVPDDLLGKKVQCPECKHTFIASAPETVPVPTNTGTTSSVPPKIPEWDKKSSSSSSGADAKKRKHDDDGYDVEDRDDNDDNDDNRPRRRRRSMSSSSRGHYLPHRGGMILAFGLISLLSGMIVFGIIAWVMGNSDLEEIRSGRMDPEGEGMTQAGRIMGMISVILTVVVLVGVFGLWGCCCLGFMGAAANNPRVNVNAVPPVRAK